MNRSGKLILASLAFLVALLAPSPALSRQVKSRVIPWPEWVADVEEDDDHPIALEVIEIKIGGKGIILGEPFEEGEDWLKKMTIRVKNIGKKPIVAFGVGGGLLEGTDEELAPYASFRYGVGWNYGAGFDPEKEEPKGPCLEPGIVVELTYENVSDLTRRVLAKVGEGAFCKLELMAPAIQYSDGTTDVAPGIRLGKRLTR